MQSDTVEIVLDGATKSAAKAGHSAFLVGCLDVCLIVHDVVGLHVTLKSHTMSHVTVALAALRTGISALVHQDGAVHLTARTLECS